MDASTFLARYIGDSPIMYMVAGLTILVFINVVLIMYIAGQSKLITFKPIKDFLLPLIQDIILLLSTQALVIAFHKIDLVYQAFFALQVVVFATVLIKYYRSIRMSLKTLGMKTDSETDRAIDERLNAILGVEAAANNPAPEVVPSTTTEEEVEVTPEQENDGVVLSKEAEESYQQREDES